MSESSAPSGAAPDMTFSTEERSRSSTAGCLASASAIGGTTKTCEMLVLLDQVEELLEVEARHRDDRRARAKALVQDHRLPVDVEEGQDAEEDVVLGDPERVLDLHEVRDEVLVREHHALGQAGRAARVRQDREVVARDVDVGRIRGIAHQLGERRRALGLADDEDLLDARRLGRLRRDVQELRDRQEVLRPGVLELVLELAGGVERVGGRGLAAGASNAVERDRVLGQVRHVDAERSRPARSRARRGPPRAHGSPGRARRR